MNKVDVKFSEWIQKGFELFKQNAMILILVHLIGGVIAACSAGVLLGPMVAGFILVTLALLDKKEPKPEIGDLFKGFNYFLQSFLFVLVVFVAFLLLGVVLRLIPCIGHILSVFASVAAGALLMFTMFLITDRKMDFRTAIMESVNVVKSNFWPFLGFGLVANVIGGIGSVVCCVGGFITMPIYTCILAVAYREIFSTPSTTTQTPGV